MAAHRMSSSRRRHRTCEEWLARAMERTRRNADRVPAIGRRNLSNAAAFPLQYSHRAHVGIMAGRLSNEQLKFFKDEVYLRFDQPVFPQAKASGLYIHFY